MRALALALVLAFPAASYAVEGVVLHQQGFLLDANDRPVDGPVKLTVKLWKSLNSLSESAIAWQAVYPEVRVARGAFALDLGADAALPPSLFGQELWVGITVNTGSELRPRLRIGLVAAAAHAHVADTASTVACAGCITAAQTTGLVAISDVPQDGSVTLTGTLAAAHFVGDGAGLTNVAANAANLVGKVADAQLASAFAHLAGPETFTGPKTFEAAPAFTASEVPFTVASGNVVAKLNADRLDGKDASDFADATVIPSLLPRSGGVVSGTLGIGTQTAPTPSDDALARLDVAGGVRATFYEFDTSAAACTAPFEYRKASTTLEWCYLPVSTPMTWREAETFCERSFGGFLAFPDDVPSNVYLTSLRDAKFGSGDLWLGVSVPAPVYAATAGQYTSVLGAQLPVFLSTAFGNWVPGEPSPGGELCVGLYSVAPRNAAGMTWNNFSCTSPMRFICQRRILDGVKY